MGSGNKEKRKKNQASGAPGKPGSAPQPSKGGGDPGGWNERRTPAGVSFELEPDADAIFLESIKAMDEGSARGSAEGSSAWKKKRSADERLYADGGGGGRVGGDAAAPMEIDLHRLTLEQARTRVDQAIADVIAQLTQRGGRSEVTIKIVTGKGLHSGATGSVLPKEIHRHVRTRYAINIVSIEESPADVTIGGVPIRGHFHVTLRVK